jgi:hypothetical protein
MDASMIDKERLLAAAAEVAARLDRRSLCLHEFTQHSGIGFAAVYRHFETWSALCVRAGLVPPRTRHEIRDEEIFEGLRRAFIAYGGVGARLKIEPHLEFSTGIVTRRFVTWRGALEAFRRWLVTSEADFPHMGELGRRIALSGGPLPRPRPPSESASAPPDASPSGSPNDPPSALSSGGPSAPWSGWSSAAPKPRTWRPLDGRAVDTIIRGKILDYWKNLLLGERMQFAETTEVRTRQGQLLYWLGMAARHDLAIDFWNKIKPKRQGDLFSS